MKTLRTLLREGDPIDSEPVPPPHEVDRMRRVVLAAPAAPRSWTRPKTAAAAGALGLIVGAALWGTYTAARRSPPVPVDRSEPSADVDERRQLQFVTPGGTRVIWVFDSSVDVR
jgi:hypothetical protein